MNGSHGCTSNNGDSVPCLSTGTAKRLRCLHESIHTKETPFQLSRVDCIQKHPVATHSQNDNVIKHNSSKHFPVPLRGFCWSAGQAGGALASCRSWNRRGAIPCCCGTAAVAVPQLPGANFCCQRQVHRAVPRVNLEEEEERGCILRAVALMADRQVGCLPSCHFSSARCVFQAASPRVQALTSRSPSGSSFRSRRRRRCPAAAGAGSRESSAARPARSARGCGSSAAAGPAPTP